MTVHVVSGNVQEKHPGGMFINQQQWHSKNTSVKIVVWVTVMLDQEEKFVWGQICQKAKVLIVNP